MNESNEFPAEGATDLAGGQVSAVRAAAGDPAGLETLYQRARATGAAAGFAAAIESVYAETPGNLLFGAWHYRLLQSATSAAQPATSDGHVHERAVWQWRVAIPMSVLLGLAFWILSASDFTLPNGDTPLFVLLAPSVTAALLIAFLAVGARAHYVRAGVFIALLGGLTAYVYFIRPLSDTAGGDLSRTYQNLALLHLPLAAWGLIGLSLLGLRFSSTSVFGFLTKSIEAIGTGGVFAIAGGIFVVLTVILFQTLGVNIDSAVMRLLVAGGGGLIPLIAVSAVYDTSVPPERQEFRSGFGKILAVLMQALLALSLIVMAIYLLNIPFNFSSAFEYRDTLIIYNIVLIGVMGVLLGATPFAASDLSPRMQRLVRAGIVALAIMVAAVLYRTAQDALTMNRLTVIGWNVINIAILALLLIRQYIGGAANWIVSLHATFRWAAMLYLVWALFTLIAAPLIF
jgi:hypothetical protein